MPVYNLIEHSNNYSKLPGKKNQFSLILVVLIIFLENSAFIKFKQKITGKTVAGGTKNIEIIVSLKYLSTFWRTLKMPLINCKINLIVTWSDKCAL